MSILGGILTGLSHAPAPTLREYKAQLRSFEHQVEMKLPAQVPVKSIVVAPGQDVVEGQTIALLNQDIMELEIKSLRRSILVDSSLRHCLLDPSAADVMAVFPDGLDAESQLQMRTAIKDCQLTHLEHVQQIRRLKTMRDRQKARLALLEHRASLTYSLTHKAEEKAATVVEFALEKERLAYQLEQLEFELATLDTVQNRALLSREKVLQQDVMRNRRHLATLLNHSKTARLQAPVSGKVLRVRNIGKKQQFLDETTLVSLQSKDQVSHQAIFSVPLEVARTLRIGDVVTLKLSGGAVDVQATITLVSDLEPDPKSRLLISASTIVVDVDQDILSAMEFPPGGLLTVGATTQAALLVSLEPQSLQQALWSAAMGLNFWRDGNHWSEMLWSKSNKQNSLRL